MTEISADGRLYAISCWCILVIFECVVRAQVLAHFVEHSKTKIVEDTRLLVQFRAKPITLIIRIARINQISLKTLIFGLQISVSTIRLSVQRVKIA